MSPRSWKTPHIPQGGGRPLYDPVSWASGLHPLVGRGRLWVSWPLYSWCHLPVVRRQQLHPLSEVSPPGCPAASGGEVRPAGLHVCSSLPSSGFQRHEYTPVRLERRICPFALPSEDVTARQAIGGWGKASSLIHSFLCLLMVGRGTLPPFARMASLLLALGSA